MSALRWCRIVFGPLLGVHGETRLGKQSCILWTHSWMFMQGQLVIRISLPSIFLLSELLFFFRSLWHLIIMGALILTRLLRQPKKLLMDALEVTHYTHEGLEWKPPTQSLAALRAYFSTHPRHNGFQVVCVAFDCFVMNLFVIDCDAIIFVVY